MTVTALVALLENTEFMGDGRGEAAGPRVGDRADQLKGEVAEAANIGEADGLRLERDCAKAWASWLGATDGGG